MGGSSKQTVGFKYFAGMQVAIGNCIEQILNINPDNRGWIFKKPIEIEQLKEGDTSIVVNQPNLFGGDKQEGGWVGTIDIHTGREEKLRQNEYLAKKDSELVSSFPGLSHLVYRGLNDDRGFQLISMSGMLKEVLYWPKRTRIKDSGASQWYISDIDENDNLIIVCEMGTVESISSSKKGPFSAFVYKVNNGVDKTSDGYNNLDSSLSSSAYGGVADPSQHDEVYSIFTSSGFNQYDLLEYNVRIVGWAEEFSLDYVGAFLKTKKTESINLEDNSKTITVKALVRSSGSSLPYINVIGKGTVPSGGTNKFFYTSSVDYVPVDSSYEWYDEANGVDINPIHQIREIITNDTAMNKPESMINDENFKFAARRIWNEKLGVSGAFTEKSCKEAIDELLYHIEAGARLNRQTGQYEIVLFRDDLIDLGTAQTFDKSNIKSFSIEIANIDDIITSVNVNFYDRSNIKKSSFSLDEIGSVISLGMNAQTLDFPYFMNRRNAELVGNWKLKQLSTPTRKGTFTTGKYEARKINKYDIVKITWQNQNMFEVPVRIMKIGLGDGRDNTVTLDWVEVVPYSSTVFPSINIDPPTSDILPPQPNQSIVFEMPYFEAVQRFGQTQVDAELANNPDLGYLVVATKKPQSNSINALLYTDDGTGYQQASIVDYCPVATLDQEIGYLDASFAVKNVASISQAEVGTLILCDEEVMVYQSFNAVTKILTVKRAALDTVPEPHSQDAVFYFYDAFNAFDPEQYILSEAINAKVLTTTPSGILGMDEAEVLSIEMNARPNRPYPPANVKINAEYYPVDVESDIVLTWVDRNRLQQTGGSILGWTDGGVSLESGVIYRLKIIGIDIDDIETTLLDAYIGTVNTYTFSITDSQYVKYRINLLSVRDDYVSYQAFSHTVLTSLTAPTNLTAVYSPT